jgi:hypothetical protein
MRKADNSVYMGDQFDCLLLARMYGIKVVLFNCQTGSQAQTQLYDASIYSNLDVNERRKSGIYFSASEGIHPDRVPAGPNVLQLVTYHTDTKDEVAGGGQHFIRVASPNEEYKPTTILDNLTDFGSTDDSKKTDAAIAEASKQKDATVADPDKTTTETADKTGAKATSTDVLVKSPSKITVTLEGKVIKDTTSDDDSTESEDNKPETPLRKQPRNQPPAALPSKRDHSTITRFEPYPFWTPKRKPLKKKPKYVFEYPKNLVETIEKHVIKEESSETANYLHLKTKTMGDNPLEFLADPALNSHTWPTDKGGAAGYGEDQVDRKKALESCKKLLDLPLTTKAYRALLAKTHGDNAKTCLAAWYKKGMQQANLEADLMMVDAITEMVWIPETIGAPAGKGTQLKGHYNVKMKRLDGSTSIITPSNDWVEKYIKKEVLSIVQKVAYEVKEVNPGCPENVIPTSFQGFLKVETLKVCCSATDQRVINRLKYRKAKKFLQGPKYKTNSQGKQVKAVRRTYDIPAQWMGYSNNTQENINLKEEWVMTNFPEGFLKQVVSTTGSGKPYVIIPPGDSRSHATDQTPKGPPIRYLQPTGKRTCMCLAMANAIYYLGHMDLGRTINNAAKRFQDKTDSFRKFCDYLRTTHKLLNQLTFHNANTINVLGAIEQLHLITIRGDDGKEDHCVAITSEWIFDSNFRYALPRSRLSFDLCCSSDDISAKFECVVQVARFPKINT